MAIISDKLNKILSAVFGKDVRQALHDGLDAINKETESTTVRQDYLDRKYDEQIKNMTLQDPSSAEIVDMRVAANGKTFEKAGDRLNYFDEQLEDNISYNNNVINKGEMRSGLEAHRGCLAFAPENTLKAVECACQVGYVSVEVDPQKTADGYWVLMHDETVDRTTNGTGKVVDMTLSQIQNLVIYDQNYDYQEGEVLRVPLLEDVIKVCSRYNVGMNIDGSKFTMNKTNVKEIYDLLKKYNIDTISYMVCPNEWDMEVVHEIAPELRIGWVEKAEFNTNLMLAKKYNNNVLVCLQYANITDEKLKFYSDNNIPVMPFPIISDYGAVYYYMSKGVKLIETEYVLPGGVY